MLTSRSQGASSAVEDGYVLAEAIARIPDAVEALRAYEDRRRDRAEMLVRSSRRLSRLEQAQHPVACALRYLGLRYVPMRTFTRQTTRPMRFDLGWTA
jgi:2-polyprenyl-6-methoxyphenol hydroxylase-like FAD-dependent oxidoreductase